MLLLKRSAAVAVAAVASATALAATPSASADDVVVVSSIQAAVDAAAPGDTVIVPPGRYHETVTIVTSGITIRGSRGAILDASGGRARLLADAEFTLLRPRSTRRSLGISVRA